MITSPLSSNVRHRAMITQCWFLGGAVWAMAPQIFGCPQFFA